jgi:hypothetical protein
MTAVDATEAARVLHTTLVFSDRNTRAIGAAVRNGEVRDGTKAGRRGGPDGWHAHDDRWSAQGNCSQGRVDDRAGVQVVRPVQVGDSAGLAERIDAQADGGHAEC